MDKKNNEQKKDNLSKSNKDLFDNDLTGDDFKVHSKLSKNEIAISRLKRKLTKNVWVARSLILLIILLVGASLLLITGSLLGRTKFGYYFTLAKNFALAPTNNIKTYQGRTNILILGVGGGGHEAPDLTDTIIFSSIPQNSTSIDLISLPRDIWVPALRAKLNSVYYWGNQKQPPSSGELGQDRVGGGLVLAKSTVEEIVGQPVHYAVIIDFEGFKEIIDVVGGIVVDVENSFTDEKYPIPGREDDNCDGDPELACRYETIKFDKGKTLMDGETALKFVRSRNAEGDEGTDFARATRQQKVITATKEKMMDKKVMFSLNKIQEIKSVLEKNIISDITNEEVSILARLGFEARDNISSHVLSDDLLINPPKLERFDSLYVLVPAKDFSPETSKQDWTEVHEWVSCILERNCNE